MAAAAAARAAPGVRRVSRAPGVPSHAGCVGSWGCAQDVRWALCGCARLPWRSLWVRSCVWVRVMSE